MPSVLIIDDDQTIRMLFQYVFSDAGFDVRTANDGREALDKLAEITPDLMLVDLAMPVMGGVEFAENIKKLSLKHPRLKDIPFIVMTGENSMESVNRVFEGHPGFKGFVTKMTQPERVLDMVNGILKR